VAEKNIAIIGNGISGITAARFIRKFSNHSVTVISKESDHFYSRTALMYIYMGHMKYEHTKPYEDFFWDKNRINLLRGTVKEIDFANRQLHFDTSFKVDSLYPAPPSLNYDVLILATGSKPRRPEWPGMDSKGVTGLYDLMDLEYMEQHSKGIERGIVVGGGLIGIEMAEMMASRDIPVSFLVRESHFYNNVLPDEEAKMASDEIRAHGIDLRTNTEVAEILADESGHVTGVKTTKGELINGQFAGVTIGVEPNIDFLKNSGLELNKGILINRHFETNVEGVYAIGDCAEFRNPIPGRKSIEQLWYTGRIMGETLAHTICGNRHSYQPGIFFNSAKFFGIEYQVYGEIPCEISGDAETIFWKSKDNKQSIRINYDSNRGFVRGFNLLGVRFRQEVCEKWIEEKTDIQEVVSNLSAAAFDQEFATRPERAFIEQFERQRGIKIKPIGSRGWKTALKSLLKT